uniref:Uncharacterized protein n=1 Tax=Magnetococcus massalia (strain MO-1) TaxID=451514 RepID=A0A1S7LDN9_MAGMO|nr:protein of unknown function [Candidatus Magnetococcus massalia]
MSGKLYLWVSGKLYLWVSGKLYLWVSGKLYLWVSGKLYLWVSGQKKTSTEVEAFFLIPEGCWARPSTCSLVRLLLTRCFGVSLWRPEHPSALLALALFWSCLLNRQPLAL